ncbi:MAG: ABC transporter substrate-binding protein [Fibrobacter sp.]|nr:ABC transporter substrate-binding protein [Fibrobacter sp.]
MRTIKIHKMLKINTLRTFFRSILGARTALLTLLSLSLLACSGEKKENGAKDCAPLPSLQYSKNLKIGESCGERVAEIRSIVGRDTLTRRFSLEKPLSRVVAQSSAQIGYLLKLGLGDRIVGVSEGQYIADSALYARVQKGEVVEVGSGTTLSLEKLVALKPDLVMNFATGAGYDDYERIEALGLPLMLTSEWQEDHPLAKAEWIKLYGILFGVEQLADSIYEQSKLVYLVTKIFTDINAARIPDCPRVIAGMSYGGVWYAPGGQSYTAQLIRDAGGCYLWASDSSRELRFSLEEIIALADSVDVWFNPGMFSTPDEILATEPRVAAIKAFKEKRVFQNDARKGPSGGNDFYESAVARPEKVLEDFIWAINASPDSAQPRWYRNIFNF